MSMTDYEQALVFAAKNGNEKSFEELYKLYYQKVYSLAKMTLKNDADAEDVLQQTFIQAWKNISTLEDNAAFNTWIQRITLNQCYSLLKKSKPDISIDDESDEHGVLELESDFMLPEVYAQKENLRARLGEIIDSLSEVQRQTIQLYYFDELSVDEISDTMECSTGTVKSRLFLARKTIRTEIEETERKTGQKFYGIGGVPVLAFSQLFKQQTKAALLDSSKAASVFSEVSENLNFQPNISNVAHQSYTSSGVNTAAEDVGKKAASPAKASAAVSKSAAVTTSRVAKKATTGLITRIVAGVLSAAMIVSGGTGVLKEVRAQSPTFNIPAETEFVEYKNTDLRDVDTAPDYSVAYSAYLEILQENREKILSAGDLTTFQDPIALCNIMGDDTPELLFISYDTEQFVGYFSIYQYSKNHAECVHSENISQWEDEYETFTELSSLFFANNKLYVIREGGADDIAFYINEYSDGEKYISSEYKRLLSYAAHYQSVGDQWEYSYEYTVGDMSVEEQQFNHALTDISNRIDCVILSNHHLMSDLAKPYVDAETQAKYLGMTFDKATTYLKSFLGIGEDTKVTDEDAFSMIEGVEFYFGSGVGAWGTVLKMGEEGRFVGNYHDTNMGDTGEDYPNGTVYLSNFHGKFKNAKKIDNYTYSLELDELVYDEPFEDYYENGLRYIIEDAGELDGKEFMLYLPKSIVKNLPEEFVKWVSMPNAWSSYDIPTLLPFYGLYNVEKEYGFSSSEAPYPQKYNNWNEAYEDFIFSGDYECGHDYDAVEYRTVALCDMDGNGVPELMIENGVNGLDQKATYVFTFADGRIRFCGNAGSDLKIGPAEYPGLFRSFWLSGYYMPSEYVTDFSEDTTIRYYTLEGNEIKPIDVVHRLVDYAGNQSVYIVTDDKGLYEASLAYDSMKSIGFVPMKQLLERGWNKKYVKLETRFASEDYSGDSLYENCYYDVICCDLFGNSFWIYTTASYPLTELSPVEYIGATENCHFLFEGGYITCLNEEDGVVLWSTQCAEDGGSPAVCIDENGTVYEIGYYGHTLSVIDRNGNFYGSYTFPDDCYWATEILVDNTTISVTFSGDLRPETITISKADLISNLDPNQARMLSIRFDDTKTIDLNWGWELFNRNASEYSHDLAITGCVLSQAAELGQNEAEDRLSALGFENPHSIYYSDPERNTPGTTFASAKITLEGEEKVLVAIVSRGTDMGDIGDILTDVYSVHNGFYDAADNVSNNFKSYYRGLSEFYGFDVNADNTILYITGHSLGGAIAGQLAEMTEGMFAHRNNIFAYTFASPNYETFKYDRAPFTNVHNIINTQDAVPNLPWGYKRYGHDWYYDGKGSNIVDQHLLSTYLNSLLSGVPQNIGSGAVNTYSLSSIHCPVDIQILDADGKLIAWTEESSVHYTGEPTLVVLTQDEAKYIYAPESVDYSIVFVGTGNGKMNYTQQTINMYSQDIVTEKAFENIEIVESKTMCCEVSGKETAEGTKLYVVDSTGKAEKLITENGAEESPFISGIRHSGGYVLLFLVGIALLICDIVLFRKKKQKDSTGMKI